MDELIVKHLNGAATDIEARTLEHWRAESPEHEQTFQDMCALWRLSSDERDAEPSSALPPDVGDLLAAAERRRDRERAREGRRAVLRSPLIGYGLAAAAVLALVFVWPGDRPGPDMTPLLSPIESTASEGDIMTLSLSDGSFVRLAPSTTVEFPPVADRREIVLSGRAFFAVASDDVPFVVRTAVADVEVRGTRFEVDVAGDALRLVVVEGTVLLTGADGETEVEAGKVAHLDATGLRVVSRDDIWALLDWTGGLLVFQSTPLEQVAAELGRTFGMEVEVVEALRALRVTAWFTDEPVEDVVSDVCLVAGAACEVDDGTITIGR